MRYKISICLGLGIFLFLVLFYNGIVANKLKYEASGDAYDYIHLGLSLAKTGKYGHLQISQKALMEDFKNDRVRDTSYDFTSSTAFRPPLWPLLISGIFLVLGYKLIHLIIFKILLHILGIFIFYKSLRLLKLEEIVIFLGTLLYGISPAWQLYSRVFLSEPITLFLLTLWVYFLLRFLKGKVSWWPQALIAGSMMLCHPYYLFLPFSVWIMLLLKKQIKMRFFFYSSVLCVSVLFLWITRNFVVMETDQLIITSSSGAVMAKGWNKEVPTNHTNTKGDLADETLVLQEFHYDKSKGYNEIEKMQLYKNATINFIFSHPDLIIPIILRKLGSAFNPLPETSKPGVLETGRWLYHLMALISLIYILGFADNKIVLSLALGLILSTIGITVLTYSGFRFRMPQTGLEILFFAFAINDLIRKINDLRS